jgi:hypothetical protein
MMAPLGVVFLHGCVAVKLRHLTHHRGVISGENHDSECRIGNGGVSDIASLLKASPWRQYVVLMPSVADLVFVVAQGMSLQDWSSPAFACRL